jgi:hypothetical protein
MDAMITAQAWPIIQRLCGRERDRNAASWSGVISSRAAIRRGMAWKVEATTAPLSFWRLFPPVSRINPAAGQALDARAMFGTIL